MGVALASVSSIPLEFYCPCDGLLCTNYRLLKGGRFSTRCLRCKRFDKELLEKIVAFFGGQEFTVVC